MRIVIAGCREYTDFEEASVFILSCLVRLGIETAVVLSGKCRGADKLGERFATERGWRILEFPADWAKYGRAAGPVRNRKMVDASDAVICFWDGKSRGTASLIQYAKKLKRPLFIKYITIKSPD